MFLNASVTLPTLRRSPFNKVRTGLWGGWANGEQWPNGTVQTACEPTRFNVSFWQHVEGVLGEMRSAGIHAEIILFSPSGGSHYPQTCACLGGTDSANYNLTLDRHYIKYVVSRLASYRNVWWSMANEWNQVRKTGFLSHLYINVKVIFLPRQARDKHRKNSKKARFVEVPLHVGPHSRADSR
jgi:hypothetical protein